MKRFIYFTFVVLSTLALFSACSDSDDIDGKPDVTVTFDSQGGSAVASITVEQGTKITKPTDPTKEGEIFAGWFKEQAATTAWDFQNNVVEANMTLYAKWVSPAEVFTVTFETNGGSALAPVEVASGAKVTKPADPVKEGFTLENWYSNAALTTAYNFASPVTANLTLYAKWTEVTNADRQDLIDLLGATYAINTADYTPESVAVLAEAQAAAQNVVDNVEATGADIVAAHTALQEAFDALIPIAGEEEVTGLVVRCANLVDGVVYISPDQWISIQAYATNANGEPVEDRDSKMTFEYDATQIAKWGNATTNFQAFTMETKKEALEVGTTDLTIRSVNNPAVFQTVTLQVAQTGEVKQIFLDMVAALPEPAAISYDDRSTVMQAQTVYLLLSEAEQNESAVAEAYQKIEDCFVTLSNLPLRILFSAFTGNTCTLSKFEFDDSITVIGEFTYTANGAFPAGVFMQNGVQESYGQFTQTRYTFNPDGTGKAEYRMVENAAGDDPSEWFPDGYPNGEMLDITFDGSQAEGGTIYYKTPDTPW